MSPTEITDSDKTNGTVVIDETERQRRRQESLSWGLSALWSGRAHIVGLTSLAAIGAIVISLLLPNWYQGSARVLVPDSGGGAAAALLGSIAPQAARLLGGGGAATGDYTRLLAILTSNSMMDGVIEEFDLMQVYETADGRHPVTETREILRERTDFEVDRQYNFLRVSVIDRDPERAAAMANFFVDELNRRNAELSAQNAANYRRYVEQRHDAIIADLDAAQAQLQQLQEEMGVVELPSTAEAFMRGMAEQRAGVVQLEIQHGALLNQYGPDNPRVRAAGEALRAARSAQQAAFQGRDPLMPIGRDQLPAAVNRYATVYRDVLMFAEMLKVVQPIFEQARFEEEREKVAVQVVDRAAPPERKAKPYRALIVVSATLSVFFLAVMLVLALGWITRHGATLRASLGVGTS